jgi:hypothetical protein
MHDKVKGVEKYLNPFILIPILFALQASLLLSFGRSLICWCGNVKLFVADSNSTEGSQQLFDFYTFSHIIHGFVFYAFLSFAKKLSLKTKFLIAVLVEIGWEVLENTPMIINHYRNGTVSDTYNGDSVVNSLMDVVAMMFGFYLASKLPVWASISLIILMEVATFLIIRDNLTFNILMFIYPFKFIQNLQMEA